MGTHDLDTIEGPFSYEALPHKDIKFVPLNKDVAVDGDELMELYAVSSHFCKRITKRGVYINTENL